MTSQALFIQSNHPKPLPHPSSLIHFQIFSYILSKIKSQSGYLHFQLEIEEPDPVVLINFI